MAIAPSDALSVSLEIAANQMDGYAFFDNVTLDELDLGDTIYRSVYSLIGQPIATRIISDAEPTGALYYFQTDHLGSVSATTNSGGNLVGEVTRFDPFGNYRPGSGPNDYTDRGFTGHKHNDDLGLIYMNARYYLPNTNRMLTPDTIIPDPANPQSYNRYSYARNNPINRTDPSGHIDIGCDVDCTPVTSPTAGPPPTPLILFGAADGEEWTPAEKAAIRNGALAYAAALVDPVNQALATSKWASIDPNMVTPLTEREAFLQVFGGPVTFYKTGTECPDPAGCRGQYINGRIEVYTDAGGDFDERWAVHELGHVFETRVNVAAQSAGLTDRCCYARNLLGADTTILRRDQFVPGSLNNGFAGPLFGWQQSPFATTGEELADMSIGWVYGQWETSGQGTARSRFMRNNMSNWINLIVSQ